MGVLAVWVGLVVITMPLHNHCLLAITLSGFGICGLCGCFVLFLVLGLVCVCDCALCFADSLGVLFALIVILFLCGRGLFMWVSEVGFLLFAGA